MPSSSIVVRNGKGQIWAFEKSVQFYKYPGVYSPTHLVACKIYYKRNTVHRLIEDRLYRLVNDVKEK